MSWSAAATAQAQAFIASLAQPDQAVAAASAVVAAVLVIVSTVVKTMIPLRWLAVGSSLGFIAYGLLHPSWMMVLLHSVLLPVHLWRVRQMVRLTRRLSQHADPQQMQLWLRPYMRSHQHAAGSEIFRQGEQADRLYFLVDGQVVLPEVGQQLQPGQMFGEIAFFAPDKRRSSSARCVTACTVMSIDEDTFKQLVVQNPDFGLQVVRLIAERLSQDVQRLQTTQTAQTAQTTQTTRTTQTATAQTATARPDTLAP
jgi:CRP/FNR family transcriptional regulator, cyclic AMP receptor protein